MYSPIELNSLKVFEPVVVTADPIVLMPPGGSCVPVAEISSVRLEVSCAPIEVLDSIFDRSWRVTVPE